MVPLDSRGYSIYETISYWPMMGQNPISTAKLYDVLCTRIYLSYLSTCILVQKHYCGLNHYTSMYKILTTRFITVTDALAAIKAVVFVGGVLLSTNYTYCFLATGIVHPCSRPTID